MIVRRFALVMTVCAGLEASGRVVCGRRAMMGGVFCASLATCANAASRFVASDGSFEFDYDEGFVESSKPVKTHVEEVLVKQGKRQVGVVVDRVKINSLEDFGSPNFVGEKVVGSERNRDGVTEATFIGADKEIKNGTTYYVLEYTNASTRGDNHFLSKVAIKDGRLYILTAQARIDDYDAAKPSLYKALDSFRIIT